MIVHGYGEKFSSEEISLDHLLNIHGKAILLWYDWWHPDGCLYLKYGHRVV